MLKTNVAELRRRAYKILGYGCECCGFVGDDRFFEIDHRHNTGKIERMRGRRASGLQLVRDVLKSHNPLSLYALLCSNCNHARNRNNGVCPHKEALAPAEPS